jgi:predicted Rossmann fold flavoprotein
MRRVIVVGGGAAGFFGAITCAEDAQDTEVIILERGPQFLQKVRISGGGRCNVTHNSFDPRELARAYPRGELELIGPYHRFQAEDTIRWFESRGVDLKAEADGRIFPKSDSSQTIIDCLLCAAKAAGIQMFTNRGVADVRRSDSGFTLQLNYGNTFQCDKLLLATGGCRTAALGGLAVSLGHTLEPPVPSLFTFHVNSEWVHLLAGVSVADVAVSVPGAGVQRGPLLFTHWGVSGPVVLRLSAWGARALHEFNYSFPLSIDWLPGHTDEAVRSALELQVKSQAAKAIANCPIGKLPARLWQQLVFLSGIAREIRWAALSRSAQHSLVRRLKNTELAVTGKSLNKDEFVTCGGVRLSEVDFKTMASQICPGLYFAGELLDIDGITGGFNFQAAWTTGWIAGKAMARRQREQT